MQTKQSQTGTADDVNLGFKMHICYIMCPGAVGHFSEIIGAVPPYTQSM